MCLIAHSLVLFTLFTISTCLPPNIYLNATAQIAYYGYPLEIHEVTTEDGYILELHRIPHGLNNTKSANKTVVLFMPGLFCSGGIFVIYGSEKSLAFILADLDYDIWILNARGTTHSRKHVTLDPDMEKAAFFNFSFHEIGGYDLPASMDYILNVTGQEDLFYISFSMGTTDFLSMVGTAPKYYDKIRLSVLLAPVAYSGHIPQPLYHLAAYFKDAIQAFGVSLGIYEISPYSKFLVGIAPLCADESPLQIVCSILVSFGAGWDMVQYNASTIPLLLSVTPAGGTLKALVHYAQLIVSGKFRKYDYGILGNIVKYGQVSPPDYDLDKITSPVALYYGSNDYFSSPIDVDQLANELPNLARKYLVPDDNFNHVDFLYAKQVDTLVNDDVVKLMSKY